ncbi:ankyrin repeat protein, putative [Trichomonas vaginalis G3]|uniref:Ankyrin repeat protein, putative n=1 Tax=Trichomonas vaginalis (strain ATCC PRA-98 / G3) TaxID=412133 RepID=A2DVC0_TRIV3|nr:proteasome regulatory particle assembly [Trichomonas vaginalis G3]EAY15599.1 ankyrin repeat protein, putative [Trichomonas vaginalis G3]KAI5530207.1 proteasome regulatory particle assembly [Trichomonas vaginalis G3]|eukprot:XP_001327822.1 ankyrin repeat protein [Trichomonas vaginalis G3]
MASFFNYKEIVQVLISHGANINIADVYGNNVINYALLYNNKEVMDGTSYFFKDLIAKGYNLVNSLASENNNNDLIELLITNGANVNVQNIHGNTTLHIAVTLSNIESTELLISHGASINSINIHEQTPLDIAMMRVMKEYKDFLKLHENEIKFSRGYSDGYVDTSMEENDLVNLLKLHGGKINSQGEFNFDTISIMNEFFWTKVSINAIHYLWYALAGIIIGAILLGILYRKLTNPCSSIFVKTLFWIFCGIIFYVFVQFCMYCWNVRAFILRMLRSYFCI